MNIMKLMFLGAVLASSTNLIFIGLVKSGQSLSDVQVNVGAQQYKVQADEAGYWSVQVPSNVLAQANQIQVQAQYANQSDQAQLSMPYLQQTGTAQIQLLPITSDDRISAQEAEQSLVIRGQLSGLDAAQLQPEPVSYTHLRAHET